MTQKIASNNPLSGAPQITLPTVFGASPDKPFLMRISVTGERPMDIHIKNLPDGLTQNGNTVTGSCSKGEYKITVTATNSLGTDTKEITLKISPDGMLLTPLLGFTTWNAFESAVTQEDVTDTAKRLVDMGLAEVGYNYVNLDSGWQKEYGGEYDAVIPNEKFPDIKAMYSFIHSLGLKGGIYSTPMLTAWGCPSILQSIPGCTRGEADIRFPETNGGIGTERCEGNNVNQWTDWGVDYLKYDWGPTDPVNADPMKQELLKSSREIAFCATVSCSIYYKKYWQKNCCSFRDGADSVDNWENILSRFLTVDKWAEVVIPGHFYDLDMLGIGPMYMNDYQYRATENEALFEYTYTAFFASPIQLSMRLEKLSEFEFNLITNNEIIAVNQDVLCNYPKLFSETEQYKIYKRELADGSEAYAVFNLSNTAASGKIKLRNTCNIRNLWEKENIGVNDEINFTLEPHAAAVFKAY